MPRQTNTLRTLAEQDQEAYDRKQAALSRLSDKVYGGRLHPLDPDLNVPGVADSLFGEEDDFRPF